MTISRWKFSLRVDWSGSLSTLHYSELFRHCREVCICHAHSLHCMDEAMLGMTNYKVRALKPLKPHSHLTVLPLLFSQSLDFIFTKCTTTSQTSSVHDYFYCKLTLAQGTWHCSLYAYTVTSVYHSTQIYWKILF